MAPSAAEQRFVSEKKRFEEGHGGVILSLDHPFPVISLNLDMGKIHVALKEFGCPNVRIALLVHFSLG